MDVITYTMIQHKFRIENKLTCNEYVVADMINVISCSRKYSDNSWCVVKREEMATIIGISRRSLQNIIDKLIADGFVEKQDKTNRVRTTEKWQEVYISNGKKVPTIKEDDGKKVPTSWEESSHAHLYIYRIKGIICEFFSKDEIFDSFWSLYGKPNEKSRARKKFLKIAEKNYQKIFDSLPAYIESTPDIKYRKNAVTWLNGECWLDEIETHKSTLKPSNGQIVMPLENNTW